MKHDRKISSDRAEYAKFMLGLKPKKNPGFRERISMKILMPFRRMKSKLRSFFWSVRFHLIRHYQLHLVLKNEDKHILASGIFESQRRIEREPKEIEGLFRTISRRLAPLRNTMESVSPLKDADIRGFRGQFVKTVREHRGLSREQVCRLLNSHKEFFIRGHRYYAYWMNFPFTPDFIEKFEEQTTTLIDQGFGGGGFGGFGAAGFPTDEFAGWLSKIYCAEEEYTEFKSWYTRLELKKYENG